MDLILTFTFAVLTICGIVLVLAAAGLFVELFRKHIK
jgi:hypothetical protein